MANPQPVSYYQNSMQHALGGAPDSRLDLLDVFNKALRTLFTMHDWKWRNRPPLGVDFVQGQSFIPLPVDLGELIEVQVPNLTVWGARLCSMAEIMYYRGTQNLAWNRVYVVSLAFNGQQVANPATAPTINVTGGGAGGGSLTAGTYYARYSWTQANGESASSPESAQFTVAAGNIPRVTIPAFPTGITGANLYLTPTNYAQNNEQLYSLAFTGATLDLTADAPPFSSNAVRYSQRNTTVDITQRPPGPSLEIWPTPGTATQGGQGLILNYRAGAIDATVTTQIPNIRPEYEHLLEMLCRDFIQAYEEDKAFSQNPDTAQEFERLKELDGRYQAEAGMIRNGAVRGPRRGVFRPFNSIPNAPGRGQ